MKEREASNSLQGILEGLPGKDYPWVDGHILKFSSGVIGVPVEYKKGGWWRVKVVGGNHPSHSVGGYDILVPPQAIEAAERIVVT